MLLREKAFKRGSLWVVKANSLSGGKRTRLPPAHTRLPAAGHLSPLWSSNLTETSMPSVFFSPSCCNNTPLWVADNTLQMCCGRYLVQIVWTALLPRLCNVCFKTDKGVSPRSLETGLVNVYQFLVGTQAPDSASHPVGACGRRAANNKCRLLFAMPSGVQF